MQDIFLQYKNYKYITLYVNKRETNLANKCIVIRIKRKYQNDIAFNNSEKEAFINIMFLPIISFIIGHTLYTMENMFGFTFKRRNVL